MAKSKSSKPKFDIKEFMLKKGEYVVLGVAGAGLLLLLFLGGTTYTEAKDPKKIADGLTSKAQQIQRSVGDPADPSAVPPLTGMYDPTKPGGYIQIAASDFPLSGVMFDPTARPDTKRENPRVDRIGSFQVDLVRAPMKAHDIVLDPEGGAKIAVKVVKKVAEADKQKIKDALAAIKGNAGKARNAQKAGAQPPTGPAFGPSGPPTAGPGPGSSSSGPGPGSSSSGPGIMPPGEGGSGGFNQGGMRSETTINYIPVEDLDRAAAEGKLPAMTVVPLRMVVVNATFPFKKQAEEMKRALRMKTAAEAAPFVRFDGFDVRRRVIAPDGTIVGTGKKYAEVVSSQKDNDTVGWYDYRYIDKYQELVASRMLSTHLEGADKKDKTGISAYLPYFYRYEDNLVMFLPELVDELGKYPEVKLPPILDTVRKMKDAAAPQVQKSAVLERLTGKGKEGPQSARTGIFAPTTGAGTAVYGGAGAGMMMPPPGGGEGKLESGLGNPLTAAGVEIDDILVRFIDPDVRPGYSYEYMLRVKLINPNYGNPKSMANPVLAGESFKTLPGPWTRLGEPLTVPRESHLFAYDPVKYEEDVKAAYGKQQSLEARFKLPAGNTHTVVQKMTWLEQVRVDSGTNQREPVGAWVAAEMPVARSGFIGRKTYVKLPLWSSEEDRYQLRELQTEKVGKGKDASTPKGWLVEEFVGRDVLVDFEGGKVTTRFAGKSPVIEDVNTELLIVRPDGRLMVRNSKDDMANPERVRDVAEWTAWQKNVETAAPVGAAGDNNPFARPRD
ncbi:hypothetical protein [Urbifossiella limnaea]|uniref:Uncharacterized protein n=1 Tax=Urbifossiella limnaea TaxID=2528023 RepID=A0A517Y0Z6_9BACT|nr:hypothetical protein [Urbifossiella limnaea]QDU23439.1 hypothetical protein ETAA1_54390 [Urbifossiella limnaea]